MDEQRRLTSAHALALIALFVALGGTALAALERNSVKSKQIKDGAIMSKDIRDGQVRGNDVDESTLDVAESTLDESKLDVVESTLSTVPDAAALGGIPASGYERAVNWAVVRGSTTGATIVRGTATAAARVTTGQYSVSFPPDISACAYVATNGDTGPGRGHGSRG